MPLRNGSYRNHCPACLWSRHLDVEPGDRAADCGGLMRPLRIDWRRGKGLAVIHHCVRCGVLRANRIADDPAQGDDIGAIAALESGWP